MSPTWTTETPSLASLSSRPCCVRCKRHQPYQRSSEPFDYVQDETGFALCQARNLYRSESDLLERTMGFGAAISLPWTILVAVDYEEVPFSDGEEDRRAGIEFSPSSRFSGRLGYQDLVGGAIYYTAGLTYSDANGTIDAAVLYNKDTKRTDRIILGFTMGM